MEFFSRIPILQFQKKTLHGISILQIRLRDIYTRSCSTAFWIYKSHIYKLLGVSDVENSANQTVWNVQISPKWLKWSLDTSTHRADQTKMKLGLQVKRAVYIYIYLGCNGSQNSWFGSIQWCHGSVHFRYSKKKEMPEKFFYLLKLYYFFTLNNDGAILDPSSGVSS